MKVKVKKLHELAQTPVYADEFAAGFDIASIEQVVIQPGQTLKVRTGLAFEIEPGYYMQIVPRSGLSSKTKIRLSNSPGTIDSNYRGEVLFILDNLMGKFPEPYTIKIGEKLGQGLIKKYEKVEFEEIEELNETERGTNGFGSTS